MKLFRNYVIVGLIYVFTILGVFYCVSLYNKVYGFKFDSSMDMYVLDSSYDKMFSNVSNFMYENDKFIIVYSDVSDELKKVIVDYDLSHSFLHVGNYDSFSRLIKDFKYDFSTSPNGIYFIYFSDGKIDDVIECSSFDYEEYIKYFSKVGLI